MQKCGMHAACVSAVVKRTDVIKCIMYSEDISQGRTQKINPNRDILVHVQECINVVAASTDAPIVTTVDVPVVTEAPVNTECEYVFKEDTRPKKLAHESRIKDLFEDAEGNKASASVAECKQECAERDDCFSVLYRKDRNTCNLYTEVDAGQSTKFDARYDIYTYTCPDVPTNAPVPATPTDAPRTDAPRTDAPATDGPATDAPATDGPATDAPATDAPATDAPVSGREMCWLKEWGVAAEFSPQTATVDGVEAIEYIQTVEGIQSNDACAQACLAHNSCRVAVFNIGSGACELYNKDVATTRASRAMITNYIECM
jgi:hypothetical protein